MVRLRSVMRQTACEKFGRQAPAWSSLFRQHPRRMISPERTPRGGLLLGLLSSPIRVAYIAGVAIFIWCVGQFYHPETGFSSLISIGDLLNDTKVTTLASATFTAGA